MLEIKTEDVNEYFSKFREMFEFINYSTKSKHYNDSIKLVVVKNEYKSGDLAIKGFVLLKPRICAFFVDNSSENRKEKYVKKTVVARIIHCEYNDILLNNKCLTHLISINQK